jgi:tetratricopeptide (TPR) repeat protein
MKEIVMKYILKSVLLLMVVFSLSDGSFAQNNDLELGKRYIKLGNSYTMAKDYKNANDYLDQGMKLLSKYNSFEGKYWKAVGLEYYGYLFLDMGMADYAMEKMLDARNIYSDIIDQSDGSPFVISKQIQRIEQMIANNMKTDNETATEEKVPMAGENTDAKNWSNMMLEKLPDEIYQLDCVKNIILSDNYFSDFPMGLGKFSDCLEYLDLSNNFIEEMPYNIQEFKKLKFLDLSNNNIMEINNRICDLENLEFLNLQGNRIPFEQITNLIRCLPNANIKFDRYEQVDDDEDLFEGF